MLTFTGTFRNLKNIGGKFQKLYAGNHKCYQLLIDENEEWGGCFWVWVCAGGFVEYNDLHSNTENYIAALRDIQKMIADGSLTPSDDIHVRFKRGDSVKGFKIAKQSFSDEGMSMVMDENGKIKLIPGQAKKIMDNIRGEFDSEVAVKECEVDIILDLYDKIQNS